MTLTPEEAANLRVSEDSGSFFFDIIAAVLEKEVSPDFAESVGTLIDLGSGRTDSTLRNAIREEVFPNLKKIVTVDAKFDTTLVDEGGELPDGINHTHHKEEITEFLAENSLLADLVSLIGVTNAGLKELDEYHDLYNSVRPGGCVAEAWEVSLDRKMMEAAGFKMVYDRWPYIWRRPEDVK
ncbi:hypothetical protein JW978_02705 [Candidatus Dojkabacteria bacterium]|nr:hypothetical protein [Candidatus Dojkabacteria bacterium]